VRHLICSTVKTFSKVNFCAYSPIGLPFPKALPPQSKLLTRSQMANDTSAKGGIGDTPLQRRAIECK
jgi:hypothetical protein